MTHAFSALSPSTIVGAIESVGVYPAGEPFALNSYENRVLMLRDDSGGRWVVKFYRPGRWTAAAIQEEHDYLHELRAAGVSVAPPARLNSGQTLHRFAGFAFALFPQQPGQAPELDNPAHLFALGEVIGRLHKTAEQGEFAHRPRLALVEDTVRASASVLASGWLSKQQRRAYQSVTEGLTQALAEVAVPNMLRCHGDCHLGNILGREDAFTLVDFDDCLMAPAIQDIWMLLPTGDPDAWRAQLSEVCEGYAQERRFPDEELALIEPLRSYRMVRHSAWIIARWSDPAFPRAFPWVGECGYWDSHIRQLEQQRVRLASPRWLA
ncbi:serine/threonine protein kinase [Halomonas cibimaris]